MFALGVVVLLERVLGNSVAMRSLCGRMLAAWFVDGQRPSSSCRK